MRPPRPPGSAVLGGVRLVWAGVLVCAPQQAVALLGGPPSVAGRRVARALGARHLAQGVAELTVAWAPGAKSPGRLGAAVDLLHALSGVGLAAGDRRWRRAALTDAAVATTFAGAGLFLDTRS